MTYIENVFIKNLQHELSGENIDLLKGMLSSVLPPDFTSVSNVISRLHQAYQSAIKLEWPTHKKLELNKQYEMLQKVIATVEYSRAQRINTPQNQIFRRMKEYPLSALLSQSFGQRLTADQKDFLLLLTFVICELANQKIKKSSLDDASHELRKLISGSNSFHITITLTSSNEISSILKTLRHSKDINFQLQFIKSWEKHFESFLPPCSGSEDIILDEYSELKFKKHKHQSPVNKITTNSGLVIQKQLIKSLVSEIDIDESFVEIVSLDVPDDLDLDYRAKEAALLYGNRLTLQEKKHLPWRSIALSEHEIKEVFKFINAELKVPCNAKIAAVVYLMALTSKPLNDVLEMNVCLNGDIDTADFIDVNKNIWGRKSVEMPSAFNPTNEQKLVLLKHSELLLLPLPIQLIEYLKTELAAANACSLSIKKLSGMPENSRGLISKFLNPMWKNNPRIFRRVNIAQIRALMFEKLTHKHDSSYAALLLANTEFDIPTSLYYLFISQYSLVNSYKEVLEELNLETINFTGDKDIFVGSKLCLNPVELSTFLRSKQTEIDEYFTTSTTSFNEIILRHNKMACYTALMFLAATGHRDRVEYGFSPFILDEENGYILLSDKINYVDSAIRILPLSEHLKQQLYAYRLSCQKTANLLKRHNDELATNIYQCSLPNSCSSAFLSVIIQSKLVGIGNQEISSYLQPKFDLPLNFLRHYFSSFIRIIQSNWFSKGMVGHVSNGEHLLSDHSCNQLEEIKLLAPNIDALLVSLGFQPIVLSKQKGRRHSFDVSDNEATYLPACLLRSETLEQSEQISWVRKLIQPKIRDLKNEESFEETASSLIIAAISDNKSNIPKQRRLSLVNRFINKVKKSTSWVSFSDNLEGVTIHVDEINNLSTAKLIKKSINDILISNKEINHQLKVWLSLMINGGLTLALTKENYKVINKPAFMESGIFWFDFINTQGDIDRVVIDTMTLIILQEEKSITNFLNTKQLKSQYKSMVFNKLMISGAFNPSTLNAIKNIDTLTTFLSSARDEHQSGLIHAYKNKRVDTTNLPTHRLVRWLSPNSIIIPAIENDLDEFKHYSNFDLNFTEHISIKSSFELLKKVYKNLSKHNTIAGSSHKGKCTDLILSPWCEHIGVNQGANINELIEKSSSISHALILLLLWLTEVSKRKGKQREHIRISTIVTYLSKIGKPLLEQSRNSNFLKLSPEEIEKIYIDALDARNLKSRTSRAIIFKDFHQSVQKFTNLPSINWYLIDPDISNQSSVVNANIISMREYSKAMSLLSNDQGSSLFDQNVNQLILLLCYRAGLRSGEVCHLQISDIDTYQWIIHNRTSHYYTLKTTNSNRRVKVDLLFSDEEKQLVIEQILRIKTYYPEQKKAWLFSDKSSPQCLLYMERCLNRVRETLKLVTGDPNIRLHHARHSFANYLLLSMYQSVYPACIRSEVLTWLRCDDTSIGASRLRKCFIGPSEYKGNILDAIAMALGHVSPKTTLAHYIHTLDIIMASENEKVLPSHLDISKLLSISSLERTYGYKIFKKGEKENLAYQSLSRHLLPRWKNYQSFDFEINSEILNLSEIKTNRKRNVLIELNDIERIIRAKENKLTNIEITNELKLSFEFVTKVVEVTQQLKQETAYSGTNITSNEDVMIFDTNKQKNKTATKYITKVSFQDLLSGLAEKIIIKDSVKELCLLWTKSYERTGLIMSSAEVSKFKSLSKTFGYTIVVDKNTHKVKKNYGYKEGVFLKPVPAGKPNRNSIDHKFNHAMFLTSIWYKVSPFKVA